MIPTPAPRSPQNWAFSGIKYCQFLKLSAIKLAAVTARSPLNSTALATWLSRSLFVSSALFRKLSAKSVVTTTGATLLNILPLCSAMKSPITGIVLTIWRLRRLALPVRSCDQTSMALPAPAIVAMVGANFSRKVIDYDL